ncbi:hypothetical protein LTR37_002231 [Vermiconidia calcicola]|uniref:Uncharacterized protein n=1 Tax=Vermiconidia calcicola TaxID=1690605 RepID=A0ACC3NVV3_9PEZI|nr:hypothetical protein LTR37_002231 [Vermiconidia calcicola]
MLATSTYTSSAHHAFLPTIPSPLSPRSANIYGWPRMSSSEEKQKQKDAPVPFAKRPVKKAPSPKPDELKERRRNLFLKKVKNGREERRFEQRGEDIMRLDYMQRQKQWEAELARDAPQTPSDPPQPEDEEELPTSSNAMQISQTLPEDEVDDVLQWENQELEALLSYMPQSETGDANSQPERNLWSDDDDYDALFSEFMEEDEMMMSSGQQNQPQPSQDHEAMDMS